MHAEIDLTQIALIVLMTLGCGLIFERLKQPAVLGYIVGGVILSSLNMAGDRLMISALAELGVIMLLFLIGLELSIHSFKKIWAISLGVTAAQITVSTLVVLGLGQVFDIPFGLAVVLAFSIALSSTAVAIKMLESIGELRTETGRLAVGILIAQDLVIVPMIIFVRGLGGDGIGVNVFIKIALAVGILIAIVLFLSRREKINLPFAHLFSGHEDLQPLVAMLFCFGMASLSGLLQLSAAYGAFLGGLIIGNSSERQSMLHTTKPIQSVLMMVFFLSVGLLLDFQFIWEHLVKVTTLLVFITLGKTILNIVVLHALKQPWSRAFLSGLILSQMGEFAFVLSTIGADIKVIDTEGRQLIVSLAALSLALSPLWLLAARRLHDLAPRLHVNTADELLHTAYGRELKLLEKTNTFCKQFLGKMFKQTDPSPSAPSQPETTVKADPDKNA
jgi:CPA2 family monovalent cation:H+ antiporter-2